MVSNNETSQVATKKLWNLINSTPRQMSLAYEPSINRTYKLKFVGEKVLKISFVGQKDKRMKQERHF